MREKRIYVRSFLTVLSGLFFFLTGTSHAWAAQYTFTPCGATGVSGPSQAQCNTAYGGSPSVTVTSGIQYWTVPTTGLYTIEAWGAQGGSGSGASLAGGKGARMRGDFSLSSGTQLKILVGQAGGSNGGAHGNENGGGGGTFVTYTNNTPLIVAGGGGGGPSTTYGTSCTRTASNADGQTGTSGIGSTCYTTAAGGTGGAGGSTGGAYQGGAGGGLTGNGANGGTHCVLAYGGLSFTNGGTGGTGNSCYTALNFGGFGGGGGGQLSGPGAGGGYSGGGSAGYWSSHSSYGGGGGSYNNGSSQSNSSGVQTGNGQVIITMNVRCSPTIAYGGDVTLSSATSCPSGVDGVDNGDVNLSGYNLNLSSGSTFAWNTGKSITVGTGSITVNSGAQVKQTNLWYQTNLDNQLAQDDQPAGYSRRYTYSACQAYCDGKSKPSSCGTVVGMTITTSYDATYVASYDLGTCLCWCVKPHTSASGEDCRLVQSCDASSDYTRWHTCGYYAEVPSIAGHNCAQVKNQLGGNTLPGVYCGNCDTISYPGCNQIPNGCHSSNCHAAAYGNARWGFNGCTAGTYDNSKVICCAHNQSSPG